MAPATQPLSGSEFVLVAQVPKAGPRWSQVHFNVDVMWEFFRLKKGDERTISLERVELDGSLRDATTRPLVFSDKNKNAKIEIDFGTVDGKKPTYPEDGVPLLIVLELDLRSFRYQTLLPGQGGYIAMLELNESIEPIGGGHRRVLTTLDEVELRWPGCRLRYPG